MMKNFSLLILSLFFCVGVTVAAEITVEITPASEITTCGDKLQEGDYVNFKVVKDRFPLKSGDIVTGIVTTVEDNGFYGKEACVLVENLTCGKVKLKGNVYGSGELNRRYKDWGEQGFRLWLWRGGEVHLKPNKNIFTVYMEET